jgi:hypothetical protein
VREGIANHALRFEIEVSFTFDAPAIAPYHATILCALGFDVANFKQPGRVVDGRATYEEN